MSEKNQRTMAEVAVVQERAAAFVGNAEVSGEAKQAFMAKGEEFNAALSRLALTPELGRLLEELEAIMDKGEVPKN